MSKNQTNGHRHPPQNKFFILHSTFVIFSQGVGQWLSKAKILKFLLHCPLTTYTNHQKRTCDPTRKPNFGLQRPFSRWRNSPRNGAGTACPRAGNQSNQSICLFRTIPLSFGPKAATKPHWTTRMQDVKPRPIYVEHPRISH
jgi:hypothetical protein